MAEKCSKFNIRAYKSPLVCRVDERGATLETARNEGALHSQSKRADFDTSFGDGHFLYRISTFKGAHRKKS